MKAQSCPLHAGPRTVEAAKSISSAGIDWHYSATKMMALANELEHEGINLRKELALATEALAQREEELSAERRKNRELSLAIGKARELLRDSAGPFDEACTILAETTTP